MANRADVEMLNRNLDQLGDAFMRNRALQQQSDIHEADTAVQNRRADVDEAFRKAQLEHYRQMEEKAAGAEDTKADAAELAEKQKLLQTAITLNATGALDEGSLANVNKWLGSDKHFSRSGIQLRQPTNPSTKGKDAAVVNALKQADAYDQLAESETDPEKQAGFKANSKQLRDWVGHQATFAPAAGFETVTEEPAKDALGNPIPGKTNKKVTTKRPIPAAPATNAPPAAAAPSSDKIFGATIPIPLRPDDPAQRVPGKQYRSKSGQVATWSGTGWSTDAPSVAVPGFGAAQPQ